MSWFHNIGEKVSGVAHRAGAKVHGAFRAGEKFLDKHGDAIASVADTIGNVAATGAGIAAASGVGNLGLSEALAGVAAGAKGVSAGVGALTKASRGDYKGAVADVKKGRKAIQRKKK